MLATELTNNPAKLKRVARMLKVISHPARLKIVDLLIKENRKNVKEIYETVGISQSNASQHLKSLEDVEVLQSEREGKSIYYSLQKEGVKRLLQCVNECATC